MKCVTCLVDAEKGFVCSGCKVAVYCSRNCQKSDWRRHKPSCTKNTKHNCSECKSVALKAKSGKFKMSACHRKEASILFEEIAKMTKIPEKSMKIIVKVVVQT